MIGVVSITSLESLVFSVMPNQKASHPEDGEIEQKLLILDECRPLLENAFFLLSAYSLSKDLLSFQYTRLCIKFMKNK